MRETDPNFGWHGLSADARPYEVHVDPRRRLQLLLLVFIVCVAMVIARAGWIVLHHGDAYRQSLERPNIRREAVVAARGRILTRDGRLLAHDRAVTDVAVHYRWFEEPPDPRWLRAEARRRLPARARRDRHRLAQAEAQLRVERVELARRLCELCGTDPNSWRRAAASVQRSVERMATDVRRRRERASDLAASPSRSADPSSSGWRAWATSFFAPPPRASEGDSIIIREQVGHHVLLSNVPTEAVAEIEANRDRYSAVQIRSRYQRVYPAGSMAAHVVGHLGHSTNRKLAAKDARLSDQRVGLVGIEAQYDELLRGIDGLDVEWLGAAGQHRVRFRQSDPVTGQDVVLSIDADLQTTAEALLDAALARRLPQQPDGRPTPGGAAAVAIDIQTGELLLSASAPTFDPGWFVQPAASRQRAAALASHDAPLLDRASRMALPPGSIVKPITALALLNAGVTTADETYACRGYWQQADRMRCAIFARHGVGHGSLDMAGALVESCNTYFFEMASRLPPVELADWLARFGCGRRTGIELAGESSGRLPDVLTADTSGRAWQLADTLALAIGQSRLTVTPLQVARWMTALATDGQLVQPRIVARVGDKNDLTDDSPERDATSASEKVPALDERALAVIRDALARAVSDRRGTGHAALYDPALPIAGKTGTAQVGTALADHAWFAGYAPADRPRVVVVVAIEHAGSGADAAGPVARRLFERLQSRGFLKSRDELVGQRPRAQPISLRSPRNDRPAQSAASTGAN